MRKSTRKTDPGMRLCRIVWSINELRRVRDNLTPAIAPQSARRIRALLKSLDGARRHAENMIVRQTTSNPVV